LIPTLEEFEDRYANVGVERDDTPPSVYAQVNAGIYSASGGDSFSKYGYSGGKYVGSGTGSGKGSGSGGTTTIPADHGYSYWYNGREYAKNGYSSQAEANAAMQRSAEATARSVSGGSNSAQKAAESTIKKNATTYFYGGIVDYTGPAWVDGSKSKPEAFLNPYDTEMIQRMTDALNYIRLTPSINPSVGTFDRPEQNFGDINITINQATLENDADIGEVARRVGRAFTKQLSKEGLNLSRYSF